ncbi:MAG: threonine/serine dehydratase [Hyphomicrobiaceae bacterium]
MQTAPEPAPGGAELADAERALASVVRETPLLSAPALDRVLGMRVLVKAESLQLTGSFKMRGAYYRLTRLGRDGEKSGVVAFSSGNFAQGLAAAGQMLGIPVTIVMPFDAPPAKIESTRGWGANVVLSEHGAENREVVAAERARRISAETGATLLHPFDDPLIVAGQSTAAAEMLRQAKLIGVSLDAVLVPVGGGGLLAGSALALEQAANVPEVIAVEPAGYDDFGRSLVAGERVGNAIGGKTLCDALQAAMPGAVTFGLAQGRVQTGIAVDDIHVRRAMALAFQHLKIVLEPSGAVGLAALLSGALDHLKGATVAVLGSGGNIALEDFTRLATIH